MGRRRRKVVRVPKRQLPKFFDCPECGKLRTIVINILQQKSAIIARCGVCGTELDEDLPENKKVTFKFRNEDCPSWVGVRPLTENRVIVECGRCGGISVLQLPLEGTPIGCSCEASGQVRLTTYPAERLATLVCSSCGLTCSFLAKPADEPVDVYGRFLDRYYGKG